MKNTELFKYFLIQKDTPPLNPFLMESILELQQKVETLEQQVKHLQELNGTILS